MLIHEMLLRIQQNAIKDTTKSISIVHKQIPPPHQPWNMSACKLAKKKKHAQATTQNTVNTGITHWYLSMCTSEDTSIYMHTHGYAASFIYLMHTFFCRSILLTSCTIKVNLSCGFAIVQQELSAYNTGTTVLTKFSS